MEVSAFARGYLALIDANNKGQGLGQAADSISPTIDLRAYLGANLRKSYVYSQTNMVTGVNSGLIVPVGKVWHIRAMSANMGPTAGAGNSVNRATLFAIPPEVQGLTSLPLTGNVTADGAVPDSRGTLVWQPVDWIANAGTQFGVLATITGVVSLSMHAYVDELQA